MATRNQIQEKVINQTLRILGKKATAQTANAEDVQQIKYALDTVMVNYDIEARSNFADMQTVPDFFIDILARLVAEQALAYFFVPVERLQKILMNSKQARWDFNSKYQPEIVQPHVDYF